MVCLELCETSVDIGIVYASNASHILLLRDEKNPVLCVTAIATNFAGIDFNENLHNDW